MDVVWAEKSDKEEKLSCGSFLVKQFVTPGSARAFALGTAAFYASYLIKVYTCMIAVRTENRLLLMVTLSACVMPCLTHSVNTYFVLSIVQSKLPTREKLWHSLMCVLNTNRAIMAYRFLEGTPPIWSLLFKDKMGHLTFGLLPSTWVNLQVLLHGELGDFDAAFVAATTLFGLMVAARSVTTVHKSIGPPGNMQKYRFWDAETTPTFHILMMLLIDFSQLIYRAILFASIGAILGPVYMLLTVAVYGCACASLTFVGLSLIQAYDGFATLMSAITGLEDVLYDYTWLEPVPVYSFYIQVSFFLRCLQGGCACGVLIWHPDETLEAWRKPYVGEFLRLGGVCFLIYIVAYPFFVFWCCRERVQDALQKRDEFVAGMMEKRKGRRLEKIATWQKQSSTSMSLQSSAGTSAKEVGGEGAGSKAVPATDPSDAEAKRRGASFNLLWKRAALRQAGGVEDAIGLLSAVIADLKANGSQGVEEEVSEEDRVVDVYPHLGPIIEASV